MTVVCRLSEISTQRNRTYGIAILFLYQAVLLPRMKEIIRAQRPARPECHEEWGWQWVFPATRHYVETATGERRRHHLHESVVQRATKDATRAAGLSRPRQPDWNRGSQESTAGVPRP